MNYQYLIFTLLVGLAIPFIGIAQNPGGVKGSTIWLSVEEEEGAFYFREKGSTVLLDAEVNMGLLNSNPTVLFDGTSSIPSIEYPAENIDQLEVFTVFAPRDSLLEKCVWHFGSEQKDELLLTTHRLADFNNGRLMNNLKDRKHQPQLNTFQRFINSKKHIDYQINFGDNQFNQEIPITSFVGKLAEFIVFDRVLNHSDRIKVESYLAIKYGLTIDAKLNQSLYNSNNQMIWNAKENSNYSNNVAGVGRDEASGLFQKQSSSVYSNSILTIAIDEFANDNNSNLSKLNDLQFLIWGTNLENSNLEPKRPGLIQKLNKKWKIVNHGNVEQTTQLIFNTKNVAFDKKQEDIYWLVVDHSGLDQFDIHSTEYYPMSNIENKTKVLFDDINWENITESHFSLGVGPALIPLMEIEGPDCDGENNGTLIVAARGGQLPYQYKLLNEQGEPIFSTSKDNNLTFEIPSIAAGNYQLRIKDASGLSYQEDFYINPKDAPVAQLANEYFWNSEEELILDASIGMSAEATYEWQWPNGNFSFDPILTIDQVGVHLLKITENSCISQKRIIINSVAPNNFSSINLFPNPVTDGIFQLDVDLHHSAGLEIQLINIAGKRHQTINLEQQNFHQYQGYVPQPGMYLVKLISAGSIETRKLIVHQKS